MGGANTCHNTPLVLMLSGLLHHQDIRSKARLHSYVLLIYQNKITKSIVEQSVAPPSPPSRDGGNNGATRGPGHQHYPTPASLWASLFDALFQS